jgi:hypothetical protein
MVVVVNDDTLEFEIQQISKSPYHRISTLTTYAEAALKAYEDSDPARLAIAMRLLKTELAAGEIVDGRLERALGV